MLVFSCPLPGFLDESFLDELLTTPALYAISSIPVAQSSSLY